jgi:hypothetical protein
MFSVSSICCQAVVLDSSVFLYSADLLKVMQLRVPSTEEIFEGFMLVQCCMWLSELALIVILLHYVFLLRQHSSLADC